jgi:hypothetical protein
VGGVIVAGVAWQQPMLLRPTVVIVGLRNTLLSSLHHFLVFASPVLEPDLHLQQAEHTVHQTDELFSLIKGTVTNMLAEMETRL